MSGHDGKLLTEAIDSHWNKYRKRLENCRDESSEDAVHKLRTCTRRLLSLIDLLRTLAPQPPLRKLRKTLKAQLDGFDELRDTQVMLLETAEVITALPELQPFRQHLQVKEHKLLLQTQAFIESLETDKQYKHLQKTRSDVEKRFSKTGLSEKILSIIDTVYSEALDRYQAIDPSQPATIHRLRIAVKKLRYMLAVAQTMIPELPEGHLQGLQDYLTAMGEIQNSTVLIDNLNDFFSDAIPEAVEQHYRQRHNDLIAAYLLRSAEIFDFWRRSR